MGETSEPVLPSKRDVAVVQEHCEHDDVPKAVQILVTARMKAFKAHLKAVLLDAKAQAETAVAQWVLNVDEMPQSVDGITAMISN